MEWRITDELLRGKMFAQKTDIENYFSKINVVLENLFVQLTKLLISFSLFILLLFFFTCQVGYLREVILKVLNLVLLFQTYWDRGTELIK